MRRPFAAFLLATLLFPVLTFAYASPGSPKGYVNDFAGVLSTQAKQDLEAELSAFQKETSNEIAVAIVPNMGGDYIENFAVKLFEEWKIGTKDKDNGVLLLLAMEEREMRIEVGYGLEGSLPDSLAQRILDNELRPRLRAGDVDGAVTAGVRAIELATKGEYQPPTQSLTDFSWIGENFTWIFFVIIFIFQWFAAMLARSKSWWAGGVLGVIAGTILGWFFALSSILVGVIAIGLGLFGLLLDFIVSSSYRSHLGGSAPPWWAGGGGFGGRSSGGGFGSFGGGSSGGGGASGRW